MQNVSWELGQPQDVDYGQSIVTAATTPIIWFVMEEIHVAKISIASVGLEKVIVTMTAIAKTG